MRKLILSFFLFYICLAAMANSLHPDEKTLLLRMLESAELDSTSLAFEKDWDLSTKYKLPDQLAELQNPWLAFDKLDDLRELLSRGQRDHTWWQDFSLYAQGKALHREQDMVDNNELFETELRRLWSASVRSPRDIVDFAQRVLADFRDDLSEILPYEPATADSLSSFYFQAFSEAEDSLALKQFLQKEKLPVRINTSPLDWSQRLDCIHMGGLYSAFGRYRIFFELLKEEAPKLQYRNSRPQRYNTPFGEIVIGTLGDDHYDSFGINRLCLLIEPGGNDIYAQKIATSADKPFYIVLDLAGDDIYQNRNWGEQFTVCQGFGISADISGNDIYRGGDYAFSAGIGIQLHEDLQGEDIYDSGIFSQGAAFFGASLLIDEAGDDLYSATTMAQGMGSTCGMGAILDLGGSDRYLLGRKYTHAPLMPNDYRSMGQGMGFGFRPDFAGGTGMLYDRTGNDKYLGGIYAQGVGYWYATGILIDEEGNDVYNAVYYPQGSGIHLANGYLYDGAGDDAYYTRNGPGQGAGHDWALGILLDKSGDDAYSIPGGNGLGLNNSVGIFVDSRGNDRYERKVSNAYGFGSFSRSAGAIGLFLDTAGTDSYPDTLFTDNQTWIRGKYGIGWDLEHFAADEVDAAPFVEDALVDSLASIDIIFAAASEWEVGSAVKRVRNARRLLANRAEEAIPYILENKLDSKSGLEYRALEEFLDSSDRFKQELYSYLDDADSLKAKNALSLIAGTGDSLLIEPIKRFLTTGKYRTACLGALGAVKTAESIAILNTWCHSEVERYRYIAARSLLAIGSPEAKAILRSLAGDPSFLIRSMVRNLPEDN